jgi:hypothetical protein
MNAKRDSGWLPIRRSIAATEKAFPPGARYRAGGQKFIVPSQGKGIARLA